jgi:hypothetical protein
MVSISFSISELLASFTTAEPVNPAPGDIAPMTREIRDAKA